MTMGVLCGGFESDPVALTLQRLDRAAPGVVGSAMVVVVGAEFLIRRPAHEEVVDDD
jgi:hypothetical protein